MEKGAEKAAITDFLSEYSGIGYGLAGREGNKKTPVKTGVFLTLPA
jgi:hypothetical protein